MDKRLSQNIADVLKFAEANCQWDDVHEELLTSWRNLRGEEAMGPWRWWARGAVDDLYQNELPTREAAIAWARQEYGFRQSIHIIEARCWADDVRAEDALFAAVRNAETILSGVTE